MLQFMVLIPNYSDCAFFIINKNPHKTISLWVQRNSLFSSALFLKQRIL
ncbi:hypothetical protein RDI58_014419 [Solanum bulbocastanum]|uniref:Uncharacterized protein n=1 Tax=Solanum bulbocastanum TaxID=147425 RepID=A0AAN8TDE6_SOLBU